MIAKRPPSSECRKLSPPNAIQASAKRLARTATLRHAFGFRRLAWPFFRRLDWVALAVFVICWSGYSWLVDHSPWRERTLTVAMDRQRRVWMETMLRRDLRMVDTAIIAGLQNGTAFFASTSLLAIGAAFALLTTSEQVLGVVEDLPFGLTVSRAAWELKAVGMLAIYAYAFFKFQWSYRLFNYFSILIGAVPPAAERETAEARAQSNAPHT